MKAACFRSLHNSSMVPWLEWGSNVLNPASHCGGNMKMPQGSVTSPPLFLPPCFCLNFLLFFHNTYQDTTHSKHNSKACIVFPLLKMQTGLCLEAYLPVKDIHCKSHPGTQQRHHTDTQTYTGTSVCYAQTVTVCAKIQNHRRLQGSWSAEWLVELQ